MKLVLAEKPSVAQSIAKVLGAAKREDGYLEGNGYVVSWCVGHLVELAQPEVYDAKYSKWAYADLPIFPMDWQYEVSAGTKKQFGILKKLMAREDVASLVCATDAGREGELIFRLVYHKAGCRKPFERLWISSMEDVAIKEGFENLRSGTEYDALYEAALCRERADWIVGINATRLFSTLYGQTLNVGRVMTPTLAMAVMREAAISAFKPEPFYTVQIGLDGFTAASERIKTKAAAEAVRQGCSVAIVQKAECKEKTEKPPALYDLTSLQREANRVLGYTAQQTLDYTQNLYEKKLVTYPRTDSRFLTEDMAHSLPDLVKLAFHAFPVEDVDNIPVHAEQVMKCRYMDELTGGRGVIFATGTPVSNSMTELYTVMRYLQYSTLQQKNLTHFDSWASTFGETTTAIELAPEGTGYRARTRFAKFFNLPELMNMFKEVADIKTSDQLHLPVPEAKFETVVVQPSEYQKDMVASLSERAADVHSGIVDPSVDNMLKIVRC